MDRKRRDRRDFLQNITIVLLALSAVFLFAQTQLYSLGSSAGGGLLRELLDGGAAPSGGAAPETLSAFSAPVRTAVSGVYGGRYGSVSMTTAGESFVPLGGLLREALGSVRAISPCGVQDFLDALGETSVYFDFLEPVPLSVLAGLVGASVPEGGDPAVRRLVLSGGADGAALYLWGGECFRCASAVSPSRLAEVVSGYEFNGATFALDEPALSALAPCSLLPAETPALPVLSAAPSLPAAEVLLAALGFYPRTNARYLEPNGAEVITEGGRYLRVSADGGVRYRGGGEDGLSVNAAGDIPTALEAVSGAEALLSAVLLPYIGEAGLYLQGVRQAEAVTVLTFGYQVGGIPVRFSDGTAAAEVTLSGCAVSGLDLRFRHYAGTDETSLLLPLRQAAAIAAGQEGAELSIGYADGGGTAPVSASWLAD